MISTTDRNTIAKLLSMIGSAHDGEALAAARKAHELVQAKGATWGEALGLGEAPPVSSEPEHVTIARDLLVRGKRSTTAWERKFLMGVLAFKSLSPHQRQTLDGIAAKVEATRNGLASNLPTD